MEKNRMSRKSIVTAVLGVMALSAAFLLLYRRQPAPLHLTENGTDTTADAAGPQPNRDDGSTQDDAAADIERRISQLAEDATLGMSPAYRSELPDYDVKEAQRLFAVQHRNLLSVRTISARFALVRSAFNNKGREHVMRRAEGTLEIMVTPLDALQDDRLVKISSRVTCDRDDSLAAGTTYVTDDIYSGLPQWRSPTVGQDAEERYTSQILARHRDFALFDWMRPLEFMSHSYRDEDWPKPMLSDANTYFRVAGTPKRRSTQDETTRLFGGEEQYLFEGPRGSNLQFWSSTTGGEIRRVDFAQPTDDGSLRASTYENYVSEREGSARFPTRLTVSIEYPESVPRSGAASLKTTITLSDVRINEGISPERFSQLP